MIIINQEIIIIIISKINKIKIILNVGIVEGLVIFLMNANLKIIVTKIIIKEIRINKNEITTIEGGIIYTKYNVKMPKQIT